MRILILSLLLATPMFAMAASVPSDKAGNILSGSPELANQLPDPQTRSDDVGGLLDAAAAALNAGHTGEAQEALERAESRALDRSVPYDDNHKMIVDPVVNDISAARNALGMADIAGALKSIAAARMAAFTPTPNP